MSGDLCLLIESDRLILQEMDFLELSHRACLLGAAPRDELQGPRDRGRIAFIAFANKNL